VHIWSEAAFPAVQVILRRDSEAGSNDAEESLSLAGLLISTRILGAQRRKQRKRKSMMTMDDGLKNAEGCSHGDYIEAIQRGWDSLCGGGVFGVDEKAGVKRKKHARWLGRQHG